MIRFCAALGVLYPTAVATSASDFFATHRQHELVPFGQRCHERSHIQLVVDLLAEVFLCEQIVEPFLADSHAGFKDFLDENMLCRSTVPPFTKEVAGGQVLAVVVLQLPVVPNGVNHRLPVVLFHDQLGEVADQVVEALVAHPLGVTPQVHGEQRLEPELYRTFYFVADEVQHIIRQTPQREVAGVILPVARDLAVAVLARRHKCLPYSPCAAVPDQLQKRIGVDHLRVLF